MWRTTSSFRDGILRLTFGQQRVVVNARGKLASLVAEIAAESVVEPQLQRILPVSRSNFIGRQGAIINSHLSHLTVKM